MNQPSPYIPQPWQLPHMLATPIGGKVLIVERCEPQPPEDCREVFCWYGPDKDGRLPTESEQGAYRITNAGEVDWLFDFHLGPVGTVLACKERFLPCKGTGGEHPIKPSDASYVCFRDGSQKFRSGKYYQQAPVEYEFKWPTGAIWRSARSMPLWACRLFFRTTDIDLRRVDSMTEAEAGLWGRPGVRPQEKIRRRRGEWIVTPLNDAKGTWKSDNPVAAWGDWAWFITAERTDRCD